MLLPIPNTKSNRDDPFYRYKREQVSLEVQGQFHVWTNFDVICGQLDISKAIDKQFLLDFLKKELSQNVTRDKTTQLVKIKQTTRLALETALEKFIDRSILCQKCDLPELNDKRICRSCGSLQK